MTETEETFFVLLYHDATARAAYDKARALGATNEVDILKLMVIELVHSNKRLEAELVQAMIQTPPLAVRVTESHE